MIEYKQIDLDLEEDIDYPEIVEDWEVSDVMRTYLDTTGDRGYESRRQN